MMRKTISSGSAEETFMLGKVLGEILEEGDVVALVGDLGAGKTCLTQGIARGLDVAENYAVTSPTFTLINEYPGRHVLYHLDVYRLAGARDMEDIGYEDYFFGRGVAVIEWAEKVKEILPAKTLTIHIRYLDETRRELVLEGEAGRMGVIIEALEKGGF
jgi:tRNA threonylcarbamoyladenosine biosynthesis protein TsaE